MRERIHGRLHLTNRSQRGAAAPLLAAFLLGAALAFPAPGGAVESRDEPPAASDSAREQYRAARAAIERGRHAEAITLLDQVVKAMPEGADGWNLLAYAHRKEGRLDRAHELYQKALALDPEHRGALEYLGELYLETGDAAALARTRARLAALCPSGCEELEDLDRAIAARQARK